MSAPIWRFNLSAGLAGPSKMMGVLMPSVDRVGRRFPLTLMTAVDTEGPAMLDHLRSGAVFEQLEDVALLALEDDMTREKLADALSALSVPPPTAYAPLRMAGSSLVLTQSRSDGIAPELAAGLLAARYKTTSLWTALLDGVPRTMVCDRMPDAHAARALFDMSAPYWTEARPAA